MFSVHESKSKYPKLPGEVVLSNGERSGIYADHFMPSKNLQNMPIKNTDVLLVTYPRSGTTLTEALIVCLMQGTANLKLEAIIFEAFSSLEIKVPGQDSGQESLLKKLDDPYRLIDTHLPRWLAPNSNAGKRVFVTRDVKDVLVSLFHFYQNNKFFGDANNVEFDMFYEMFVSGNVIYSDWFQFHRDWLDRKGDNEIWLRYEDLLENFDETVKRLATFLNVELSDALLEDIRKCLSIDSMKKNFIAPFCKDFVRKGVVGDHVNYLTQEQIKYLDDKTKEIVPELCQPLV